MSSVTTSVQRESTTIIFDNHLPLRTRQDIDCLWLRYDYLDFGGHYFCCCPCIREAGKYHAWTKSCSAYDYGRGQKVSRTYLGLFASYEELAAMLDRSGLGCSEIGEIIRWIGTDDAMAIEAPEC